MPAPSQVSAQDINAEIGYGSTASVNLNETRVRNLACDASGEISYGQCRWGINFRGGAYDMFGRTEQYATSSSLDLYDDDLVFANPPFSFAYAFVQLTLNSSGTMTVDCGGTTSTTTWLTSGAAGDYTAQLSKTSGDNPTGAAIDTDLALSTTRSWLWEASVGPGVDYQQKVFSGNLIIKDGGGTLITRPFSVTVTAEVA